MIGRIRARGGPNVQFRGAVSRDIAAVHSLRNEMLAEVEQVIE